MKLVILDGLDNSGKTWTIKELKKRCQESGIHCETVHFPSKELCETEIFKKMCKKENKHDYEIKMEFVREVVAEETAILTRLKKEGCGLVLIDRFLLSTLIYQGDGMEYEWVTEKGIINEYTLMFDLLDIRPRDIAHFVFIPKIQDDTKETNETKLKFDKMYDELKTKLLSLLDNIRKNSSGYIRYGALFGDYLKNIVVFDEDVFQENRPLTRRELDILTENRVLKMMEFINHKEICYEKN